MGSFCRESTDFETDTQSPITYRVCIICLLLPQTYRFQYQTPVLLNYMYFYTILCLVITSSLLSTGEILHFRIFFILTVALCLVCALHFSHIFFYQYQNKPVQHLQASTHPVSDCGENFGSHCPLVVVVEETLLSLACPGGEAVYHQVRHEEGLDLADQQETELVLTSHCLRPHYDLREEVEEEDLWR